jgi:MFS family permease
MPQPKMFRWLLALSAYWFSSSFKWFILLVLLLPRQVQEVVPAAQRNSAWGMVFALGAVWAIVGPSLFGYWSDRLRNRRTFLLAGAGLTILALGVLVTSTSLVQISIGYLLLQVADDVGTGPYGAVIPELVPKANRGLASGIVNLATLVAQTSVALVVVLVDGGLVPVYIIIGLVTVVGAIVSYRAMEAPRQTPWPNAEVQPNFWRGLIKGWISPWRHRDFMWVWITRFLFALGMYLVQPYLQYYLTDALDAYKLFGIDLKNSMGATAALALTISVGGALSAASAGSWADKYGKKKVMYVSGAVMASTILPFMLVRDVTLMWVLSIVFGFAFGGYLSAAMAIAVDVLPSDASYGKDMGIWQMSTSSVQVLAGGAGVLVDVGNRLKPLLGYEFIFIVASIFFVCGTLLLRNVRAGGPHVDHNDSQQLPSAHPS